MYPSIIAAAVLALVLTVLLVALGTRGPWNSLWTLFMVLFLAIWVTGLYINPIGPIYFGVAWIPMIFAGIVFAILLVAVIPDSVRARRRLRNGRMVTDENKANSQTVSGTEMSTIGGFFWILIMLFTFAIIVGLIV